MISNQRALNADLTKWYWCCCSQKTLYTLIAEKRIRISRREKNTVKFCWRKNLIVKTVLELSTIESDDLYSSCGSILVSRIFERNERLLNRFTMQINKRTMTAWVQIRNDQIDDQTTSRLNFRFYWFDIQAGFFHSVFKRDESGF